MAGFMVCRVRHWALLALSFAALVLSGCAAPPVSARVTSFQHWPAGVEGQTYRFVEASAGQKNNLEYLSYQDLVRAAIGVTGLVEAREGERARFDVAFRYSALPSQQMVRQPFQPQPFFHGGFYGPYNRAGMGAVWGPAWIDLPVAAFRNTLSLEIRDNEQSGREVYRSSASIMTAQENLVGAMPFLVNAIFDSFPGNNGAEREVSMPRNR